jgi:hypothetical protein
LPTAQAQTTASNTHPSTLLLLLLWIRPAAMADSDVLTVEDVKAAVIEEVQNVQVIDVHTHLLPPSHGKLMLWGIDELLTYHYLVSEYFMVAPAEMTHKAAKSTPVQQTNNIANNNKPTKQPCNSKVVFGVFGSLVNNNKPTTNQPQNNHATAMKQQQ